MRNLTPWSANDRERNVDSIMPGKFLGGDTGSLSVALPISGYREIPHL